MGLSQYGSLYAPDTYEWYADPAETQYGGAWRHKATGSFVGADAFKNYSQQATSNWNSPYQAPAPTQSLATAGATQPTLTAQPATTGLSAIPAGSQTSRASTFGRLSGVSTPAAPGFTEASPMMTTATPQLATSDARQRIAGAMQPIVGSDPRTTQLSAMGGVAPQPAPLTPPPAATSLASADPRAARAAFENGQTVFGGTNALQRAGTLQTIINQGLQAVAGGPSGGLASATPTPGGLATAGGSTGGSTNYFPDDPQSQFDNGLGIPRTSITPESVMLDPGYRWQKEQLDRMLEDRFAAKGRVGSTDYFNTGRNQDMDLVSREYNRINTQQYERSLELNRLLYDRRYQENVLNYEREFRENERKYGREKAEEILAYERAFREDAREYERVRYLVELGFNAAQSGANA